MARQNDLTAPVLMGPRNNIHRPPPLQMLGSSYTVMEALCIIYRSGLLAGHRHLSVFHRSIYLTVMDTFEAGQGVPREVPAPLSFPLWLHILNHRPGLTFCIEESERLADESPWFELSHLAADQHSCIFLFFFLGAL